MALEHHVPHRRVRPLVLLVLTALLAHPVRGADGRSVERPWDPTMPFRGWQRVQDGATPDSYARYLYAFAGW